MMTTVYWKMTMWFSVTATLFMSLKTQIPAVPMVLITNFLGSKASLSAQKAVSICPKVRTIISDFRNDDMLYKIYTNIVLRHT